MADLLYCSTLKIKAKRFFETVATVFIPLTIATGDLRATAGLV
jgi:hypothetical protein